MNEYYESGLPDPRFSLGEFRFRCKFSGSKGLSIFGGLGVDQSDFSITVRLPELPFFGGRLLQFPTLYWILEESDCIY
jgi:hypothetical protein